MYQRLIQEHLASFGLGGRCPPHQVEAWMRTEHQTLDGLGPDAFRRAVATAVVCIADVGPARSEALARSFGLVDQEQP